MCNMATSTNLEDFEVLNVIGSGSFGTCYRVKSKIDNSIYVWKAIDYGKMNESKKQLLASEVSLLSKLKHPNIVRYFNRILHKETTILYIIMEYCEGGDLSAVICTCRKNKTIVEESFVWQVLYQTGRALQACHSHLGNVTVLHRDIKPANVFLDANGNVKLGDFGLARILKNDESYSETIVGTPYYMSPEVLKGGKYNRKSDIWALGCLVYELCALSPPFIASNISQLAFNIKNGRFNRIPSIYSDDLQKMIKFMLSLDHDYRPTIEIILHHPTVVLHVSQRCISKFNTGASSCNDVVDEMLKNDLQNVTLFDREPEVISENTFKEKWMTRLEALRQKEAKVKAKEESLVHKERALMKKEKNVLLLERLAKEKMTRAEVYLRQCKENKSICSNNNRNSKLISLEEIDTSFSADPGDTSILPTSSKIEPSTLPKPSNFVRSASERRQKHVHFKMFTKQHSGKVQHDLTANQSVINIPHQTIDKSHHKSIKSSILHCHNKTIENKSVVNGVGDSIEAAFTEERAIWLENKRIVYKTTGDKENIEDNTVGNQRLPPIVTGTLRKKTHKSLTSVFSKKSLVNLRS